MLGHPTLLIEVAVVVLFLLTCRHAARRGRRYLLEVVSAALYGLLLEEGDILIFGSYHYSPHFLLAIGHVPIAIALSWAVIIYSCMRLSDAYGLSPRLAPFADAIWAIALDFAFDAVAIRIGLWQWNIPQDAGYFGVPAGNFYAWLMVALSFSALTRWLRVRGPAGWQLAVPLAAYVGLLLGLGPYLLLKAIFFPAPGGGLPVFTAVALSLAAVTAYGLARRGWPAAPARDWWPLATRLAFHLYFLGAIFVYGLAWSAKGGPPLLVGALGMLTLETLLAIPLFLPRPRMARMGKKLGIPARLAYNADIES